MKPIIVDNFLTKDEYSSALIEIKKRVKYAEWDTRDTGHFKRVQAWASERISETKPNFYGSIWERIRILAKNNSMIDTTFQLLKFQHVYDLVITWRDSTDNKGDEFHTDIYGNDGVWYGIFVQFIIYFNPKKTWSGGNFTYKNLDGEFELEAKDNRLVILPAGLSHRIEKIKVSGNKKDLMNWRITLNGELKI